MGSLFIKLGSRSQYTFEEMREIARVELEKLKNISDEEHDKDIDFSDIPPSTEEELARMKPARLRKQKQNIAS